jgi:hypothetical protein
MFSPCCCSRPGLRAAQDASRRRRGSSQTRTGRRRSTSAAPRQRVPHLFLKVLPVNTAFVSSTCSWSQAMENETACSMILWCPPCIRPFAQTERSSSPFFVEPSLRGLLSRGHLQVLCHLAAPRCPAAQRAALPCTVPPPHTAPLCVAPTLLSCCGPAFTPRYSLCR